jgi:hypothetical protein
MHEIFPKNPVEFLANHLPVDLKMTAYREELSVFSIAQPTPLFNPFLLGSMEVLHEVNDGDGQGEDRLDKIRNGAIF